MCLIARYLEENKLPTVCVGSALDIFQSGKPPRAVFTNYPLGHSAGRPFDVKDQISIIKSALDLFESENKETETRILNNEWGEQTWQVEASSTEGVDTREERDETPQFQEQSDILAAKATGQL